MQSLPNNTYTKRRFRTTFTTIFALVWVLALGWAVFNHNAILDWAKLHDYVPPAEIARIAHQDTMTDAGKHLFYINHPVVRDKAAFSKDCPNNGGERTIVLGCYHSEQNGISLLRVSDSRLDGVAQVTAAHEMLHAAYDRLSASDRKQVDTMLKDFYERDLKDARIKAVIALYKKSEPNDVVNEMHSVFATELTDLPAALEQYYTRYFANRQQVVDFAAQYQAEFTSRQAAIASYDAQLTGLKAQIETGETDLKAKQTAITSQQIALDTLRNNNVSAYNAGIPAYNQLVDSYNSEVQHVKNLITQYNELVAVRNNVALEEDQLLKDLTGSPTPITGH